MTKPEMEPTTEEEAIFARLCAHYVQRADPHQQSMGLQYTEAETHDLARFIARLNTRPASMTEAAWSDDLDAAPAPPSRRRAHDPRHRLRGCRGLPALRAQAIRTLAPPGP